MPWKECDTVSLRKEFVELAKQTECDMTSLCERFGISRKTGYKWIERYKQEGDSGLKNRSRRPKRSPQCTPNPIKEEICHLREMHPSWGGLKIEAVLKRKKRQHVPAPSTIHNILKEKGYIKTGSRQKRHLQPFEHDGPNHLWQMDFKGHFGYEKGRCHPLTILDDHSRFSIALNAYPNEQGTTIRPGLIEVFRRYGLPERINVDNGHPWGSLFESARYTTFSVWLITLGITVSYSAPGHPQTNGKDERFHRTLKQELLTTQYFRSLPHIQNAFDRWRDIYNLERPHQAIGMKVPVERYQPSYRPYPEEIVEYDYPNDYVLRKVDSRGRIWYSNTAIFVGMPFAGKQLGILHSATDGKINICFRHQRLGQIDLKLFYKRMVNLYSKRVLST